MDVDALVSGLVAHLDKVEQEAAAMPGEVYDGVRWVSGHAERLGLVRATRDLLDLHKPANPESKPEEGLPGWPDRTWYYCETCGSGEPHEYPRTWPCDTLLAVARGWGVVDNEEEQ